MRWLIPCLLLSSTASALGPPKAATAPAPVFEHESPWFARGGELVVLVHQLDLLRGFHSVSLQHRSLEHRSLKAQPNAGKAPAAVLSARHLAWLRRKGEYDLYRVDLARALDRHADRLLARGWHPVAPLTLSAGPAAPTLELGARVRVDLVAHPDRKRSSVQLSRQGTPHSVTIAELPHTTLTLHGERRSALVPTRVLSAHRSPDGAWLLLRIGSGIPLHGDHAPRVKVVAVPLQSVIRALDLPPSAEPVS